MPKGGGEMKISTGRFLGRILSIALLTTVFFMLISFALGSLGAFRSPNWEGDSIEAVASQNGGHSEIENYIHWENGADYRLKIVYPQTGQTEIDREIAQSIAGELRYFKQGLIPQKGSRIILPHTPFVFYADYEIIPLNEDICNFVFRGQSFTPGQGMRSKTFTLTCDLKEGIPRGLDWFFVGEEGYRQLLIQLAQEKLEEAGMEAALAQDLVSEGAFPAFAFAKEGLYLYFDTQPSAAAPAHFEILLPYGELAPYCFLNEEGQFYQPPIPVRSKPLDPAKPMVALTFDDGPNQTITPSLLEALRERDALATFFVLGDLARRYPEVLIQMDARGHEIGNHGYDHLHGFDELDEEALAWQIDQTNQAVFDAVGKEALYVRPPYGRIDDETAAFINYPIIMWNVDSLDWKSKDPQAILELVSQAQDGDIILMHDLYESTLGGAILAIDTLQEQGYQFVTLGELFTHRNLEPEKGGLYYSVRK